MAKLKKKSQPEMVITFAVLVTMMKLIFSGQVHEAAVDDMAQESKCMLDAELHSKTHTRRQYSSCKRRHEIPADGVVESDDTLDDPYNLSNIVKSGKRFVKLKKAKVQETKKPTKHEETQLAAKKVPCLENP